MGSVTSLQSINEDELEREDAKSEETEKADAQQVLEGELMVDIATMNEQEVREALKLKTLEVANKAERLELLEQSQEHASSERLKASLETQAKVTRLEGELSSYRTYMDGVLLEGKSMDTFDLGNSLRGGGGGLGSGKQGAKARRRWSVAAHSGAPGAGAGIPAFGNGVASPTSTTEENLLILQTAAAAGDESARKMIRRNSKGRMLASVDDSDDEDQRAGEQRELVKKLSNGVLGGEQIAGPTSAKGRRRSMVLATNAVQSKGGQLKKGSVRRGSFFSGDTELGLRGGGQARRQSIINISNEAKGEDEVDEVGGRTSASSAAAMGAAIEEGDEEDEGERTSPEDEDEDEGERTSPEDEDESSSSDDEKDPDFEDVTASLPSPMRPELLSHMAEKLLQQWNPDPAKRAQVFSWFRGAIMRQHGKEMKLALRDLKAADYEGFSSILLPLLGVPDLDLDLDIDFGDDDDEGDQVGVGGAGGAGSAGAPEAKARMSLNPMARVQMETQKWKRASVRKRQLPLKVERRANETILYDLEVTVQGKNMNLLAGPAASASSDPESDLTPGIMAEYFMKYNPQRLANIDEILQVFHGKHTLLCQRLHSKYGESPRAPQFKPSRAKIMAKVGATLVLFCFLICSPHAPLFFAQALQDAYMRDAAELAVAAGGASKGGNGSNQRKGSIEMFWGAAKQSAEYLSKAASSAADRLEQEGLLSPDSNLRRSSSAGNVHGNVNGGNVHGGNVHGGRGMGGRKSSLDVMGHSLDKKLTQWFSPSPTNNQGGSRGQFESPGNSRGSSPASTPYSTPGTSPRLGAQPAPALSVQDQFAFYNAMGKGAAAAGAAGGGRGGGMGTRKLSHLSGTNCDRDVVAIIFDPCASACACLALTHTNSIPSCSQDCRRVGWDKDCSSSNSRADRRNSKLQRARRCGSGGRGR
jgi:hypothetical protein